MRRDCASARRRTAEAPRRQRRSTQPLTLRTASPTPPADAARRVAATLDAEDPADAAPTARVPPDVDSDSAASAARRPPAVDSDVAAAPLPGPGVAAAAAEGRVTFEAALLLGIAEAAAASPPQEKRVGTDAAPRTTSSVAPSSVASAGTSVAAFLEPAAASAVVPSSAASPGTSLAVSPEWAAAPVGASFNAAANPLVAAGSSAPLPPQGSFEKLPLLC